MFRYFPKLEFTLVGLVLASIIALPSIASAQTLNQYFGLSGQFFNLKSPGITPSSAMSVGFKGGFHLNPFQSLELIYTAPSSEDTIIWNNTEYTQQINAVLTGRLRQSLVYTNGIEAYGLLGATYINMKYLDNTTGSTQQAKRNNIDLSYGLGARMNIMQSQMTGYFEYSNLLSASQFEMNQFSLGIDYYF